MNQKDQNALDRMIELSIEVLKVKLIFKKLQNLQLQLCLNRMKWGHYESVTNLLSFMSNKREELEKTICKYADKYYPEQLGFNKEHAHFTLNELKEGKYLLMDSNYLVLKGSQQGQMVMDEESKYSFPPAISNEDLNILTLLNMK
jgi:hypothetical protein